MTAVTVDGCSSINAEHGRCSVTVISVVYRDNGIVKTVYDFVVLLICIKQKHLFQVKHQKYIYAQRWYKGQSLICICCISSKHTSTKQGNNVLR